VNDTTLRQLSTAVGAGQGPTTQPLTPSADVAERSTIQSLDGRSFVPVTNNFRGG
jgi:hypothetical protein